jgi:hypothetical protein
VKERVNIWTQHPINVTAVRPTELTGSLRSKCDQTKTFLLPFVHLLTCLKRVKWHEKLTFTIGAAHKEMVFFFPAIHTVSLIYRDHHPTVHFDIKVDCCFSVSLKMAFFFHFWLNYGVFSYV